MNMLLAFARLGFSPAFERLRWRGLAFVLFVMALGCVSSPSVWGVPFGAMIGTFGLGAFFGRRPFFILSCAFILAVTGIMSCSAIESSLHRQTCQGKTEVFWKTAAAPEDFVCWPRP